MSHPEDVTLIHSTSTDGEVAREIVLTRDLSSGKVHKRLLTEDGRLIPYGGEQDNLDGRRRLRDGHCRPARRRVGPLPSVLPTGGHYMTGGVVVPRPVGRP